MWKRKDKIKNRLRLILWAASINYISAKVNKKKRGRDGDLAKVGFLDGLRHCVSIKADDIEKGPC
jgi:hypothetical protein